LLKRSEWIRKSQLKIRQKKGKALQFTDSDTIYYLGREYPVTYIKTDNKRTALDFDDSKGFVIRYPLIDRDKIEQVVEKFYKQEAQKLIPTLTQSYADKMHLYPTKIGFRKAKRQWGSCSAKNAISFNYLMMKLPLDVIQYIIVHELAHIKHKNHQKEFWALVALVMPEYKRQEQELKNYL